MGGYGKRVPVVQAAIGQRRERLPLSPSKFQDKLAALRIVNG